MKNKYLTALAQLLFMTIILCGVTTSAMPQENDTLLYENFEAGSLPEGWNNKYEKGIIKWKYQDGGYTSNPDIEGSGKPPYAHEGVYNALFHFESLNGEKTKLVTRPIDLEYKVKPELTFWHAQDERWAYDAFRNDELRVYYKTALNDPWVLLAEYTSVVNEWEKRSILLPDSSLTSTYYIAFEGKTNNGFGVCIDEVMIQESGVYPKYVENIGYSQASDDFVATRSDNNPILRLDVEIGGNDGTVNLDSIAVTSLNTDDIDLKANGVKMFASTDTVFGNSHQIASGIDFVNGKAVFENINYEMPRGLSSIWITYDIKADTDHTTQGHILDAMIEADDIRINNNTFPLVNKSPNGSREIHESLLYESFESESGWNFTGEFERAQAQDPPLGGMMGNPDPAEAYEGSYMIGTDITGQGSTAGDYENNLGDRAYQAISPMLDAYYYQNMNLYFYRWLNVDGLDSAYVEVSQDNGQTWQTLWQNGSAMVMDKWEQSSLGLQSYINRTDSVRVRFSLGGTDDSWTFSGWNIDNVVVTGDYISQDVGVTDWIYPISGCGHTDNDSVVVVVTNFGGDATKDSIPLSYTFNGGDIVVKDTLFQSIPVGGSAQHTFSIPVNLNDPGWYRNIWAQTDLKADEDQSNNRFNHELFVSPTHTPPHAEDFEQHYGYWLKNSINSTLEHGIPNGTLVDTAASGTKVWATNLDGVYPINDSSYMESPCFNFADMRYPVFEMKLLGEAEKNKDGLALYYSVDNGVTWKLVPHKDNFDWNWYNSEMVEGLNGPGWDTTVNNWMTSKQILPEETAGQSNIKFSLVFATDAYSRFEGYAIDDIRIYEAPPDVGVASMSYPTSQCEIGPHVQPELQIANDGIDTLFAGTKIPVGLHFKDEPRRIDTLELAASLPPGDTVNFTFSDSLDMSYAGDYPFKVYTMLEDDPYFYTQINNDTLVDTISVLGMPRYDIGYVIGTPAPVDTTLDAGAGFATYDWSTGANTQTIQVTATGWYSVTVTNDTGCVAHDSVRVVDSDINTGVTQRITSVSDACEHPTPVDFTVEISNMGLASFNSGDTIPMAYQINDQEPVTDTLFLDQTVSNTGPDSTIQFTYAQSIDISEPGEYNLKFYTNFEKDYDKRNDTSRVTVNTWGYPDTELRYDTLLTTRADTLTLDAGSGFDTYSWQDGSTTQTYDITHNRSQWYKVTVTDAHGCGEDSDSTHIIATDIGIDSLVYPTNSCEFTTSEQALVRIKNHSPDTLLPGKELPMVLVVDESPYSITPSLSDSILPGNTADLTLSPVFDLSQVGAHSFKIYSRQATDANRMNDTLEKSVHTWGYPDVELARDTIYTERADTITLDAGEGFASYLWQDGTTSQTYSVSKNISAQYKVTVHDAHGCGSDSDSLQVYTYDLGIADRLAPVSSCELSNAEKLTVSVQNFGGDTLKTGHAVPLSFYMEGVGTFRDTALLEANLLPGKTFTHTFSEPLDMSAFTTYYFDIYTDHPHEVNRSSDTLTDAIRTFGYPEFQLNYDTLLTTQADTVQLHPDIEENAYLWQDGSNTRTFQVNRNTTETYHLTITDLNGCSATDTAEIITYDLGVDSILNPVTACELGSAEALSVRIRNFGADTLEAGKVIPLGYRFNGGGDVTEMLTLTETWYPDSAITHTFAQSFDLSATGTYQFDIYSDLAPDAKSDNDLKSQQVDHYGLPSVDLGPDTLFTNRADTITLDAGSGYADYLWQDGSEGQTYDIPTKNSALYHVTVSNSNQCTVSDSVQIIATDIQMLSVVTPTGGCGLTHQEDVTVELYNNSAESIPAGEEWAMYMITPQGTPHNDMLTLSEPFAAGDTLSFTYSRNIDLSVPETYELKVYLDYGPDYTYSNDTLLQTIESLQTPNPNLGRDTSLSQGEYLLDPGAFNQYEWHDGSQKNTFTVTAQNATPDNLYYVTVTNQNGCSASDTVWVELEVFDLSISEITNPGNICLPTDSSAVEIVLKNTGNVPISKDSLLSVSYQVDNRETIAETIQMDADLMPDDVYPHTFSTLTDLQATGAYELNLSARVGGDMVSANNDSTLAFEVYPVPELDLGPDTLDTTLPHTLDPGVYDTYQWQDGSTSSTFVVDSPGTYSLTVSNQYGCSDYDEIVIVEGTAIYPGKEPDYSATVYPNPAEDHLLVAISGQSRETFTIRMISTQGYLMKSKEVTLKNGRVQLEIQSLPRGIYYLRIESQQGIHTKKVILK